jgi:hypothetical protein
MWPWKKREKPTEPEEPPSESPPCDLPIATMGIVARPLPPRQPPAPEQENEGGLGTSAPSRAVAGGMEPLNSPRNAGQFDPTRAASALMPLQSVQIATPCRADWSKMEGDSKSRFCQTCRKSVYNLSVMTTPEAQELIAQKGGELCARIYRRADGTVITGDCPVGSTAPRRSLWSAGAGLAAIFAVLVSGCGSSASLRERHRCAWPTLSSAGATCRSWARSSTSSRRSLLWPAASPRPLRP